MNNNVIGDVVGVVENTALDAHKTPAKAGIAVDDGANGDDMDCDVVPVSQASVVDDDGIIKVLETGFSGNRVLDTGPKTQAGRSQSLPSTFSRRSSLRVLSPGWLLLRWPSRQVWSPWWTPPCCLFLL